MVIIPAWDGDQQDRELYDLMPFLENLGQAHGSDARQEIKKYGREGTGKKYMELQSARRDFIMNQRQKGLGGMMNKLGSAGQPQRGMSTTNQQ